LQKHRPQQARYERAERFLYPNKRQGGSYAILYRHPDHYLRGRPVGGHAKVVNYAETIFSPQDISSAAYIAYSSDRDVVGFQLNGSSDGMMLDGLPGM
jgi:hypothetical protein